MRSITSWILICISISCFSQRVSFNDPDLTFSFKKPKNWEIFDDGYLVKASPSALDSANTFFSITYFEDAQPFDGLGLASNSGNATTDRKSIKIDKVKATYFIKKEDGDEVKQYQFYKKGQRFSVVTKYPMSDKTPSRKLLKMVKSIRITEN